MKIKEAIQIEHPDYYDWINNGFGTHEEEEAISLIKNNQYLITGNCDRSDIADIEDAIKKKEASIISMSIENKEWPYLIICYSGHMHGYYLITI